MESLPDKIINKERIVRELLQRLRDNLNKERINYDKKPDNNWSYITSLTHAEKQLIELNNYFETAP